MKMTQEELSTICMEMSASAGAGRAKVFEALELFHEEKYGQSESTLLEAQELLAEAHKIQFEQLMSPQNRGVEIPFSMLLLHAMDMTMVATSEHDMLHSILKARQKKARGAQ